MHFLTHRVARRHLLAAGKRVLYHIGKSPPIPQPRRYGGAWERPWLKKPLKKAVFLTPNPGEVYYHDETPGNLYAYEVPQWVLKEAGGINRLRGLVSEVLIPEHLWDEVRFLGKVRERKYEQMKQDVTQGRKERRRRPSSKSDFATDWRKLLDAPSPERSVSFLTERELLSLRNQALQKKRELEDQLNPRSSNYFYHDLKERVLRDMRWRAEAGRYRYEPGDQRFDVWFDDVVKRNLSRKKSEKREELKLKLEKAERALSLLEGALNDLS